MTKKKVLITSALPYANGPIHFGHIAGAYLPGDCYARFERLQDNDVLYVCGSDEYGMAITLSAEQAKRTPKEHVDVFHELNQEFFKQLNFSFDHFSRTTWEGHCKPVQEIFLDLYEKGLIKEDETYQLYSEKENRFLADRYVVGTCPKCSFEKARGDECQKCGASYEAIDLIKPKSKLTSSPLSKRKTKHWFLQLQDMKGQLLSWLESKDWKPNVVNFIKNYIDDLRPRAITRDSEWGVPVPLEGTEGKVLYVWFDAPIGYISASQEWAKLNGKEDKWKDYWLDSETKLVNFIGKDNITFHGVIFPAMLMGQNTPYKIVDELPANEFYNLEGRQFSKSDGWYIDLADFFKNFTADQIRYAIAANAPENSDSEFTWKDFQNRCNSELLGKLGNFINRTMVFTHKSFNSKVPKASNLNEDDQAFLKKIRDLTNQIQTSYAEFKLRQVTQLIMELAQTGNVYFDHKAPWKANKDASLLEDAQNCIHLCIECIKCLALVSNPIIPSSSLKTWSMLGAEKDLLQYGWKGVMDMDITDLKLKEAEVLFKKVEDDIIKTEREKLESILKKVSAKEEASVTEALKPSISFDDFSKVDLRVAEIIEAEKVPKSKKLLKLRVDLGFEQRTIVSGISQHYQEADLIGKKVIVVANLKPAKLMGVESQGMLLAASLDKALELAYIQDIPIGGTVS
ncbi:Methionine--tRNA ligase [Chlamydiales bacterium SCGC AB-751-O23]|jgi:methionyl-tRNA synthetase|nr:Methionine--tRNA ligase [Chlamydiales bacterium SCGC AB-751-O23]